MSTWFDHARVEITTEERLRYKVVENVIDSKLQDTLNGQAALGWMLSTIVRGNGSWTLIVGPKKFARAKVTDAGTGKLVGWMNPYSGDEIDELDWAESKP